MRQRSIAVVLGVLVGGTALPAGAAEPSARLSRLAPGVDERESIELAPFMGELQRLTHKLSLSVASANPRLAGFYAYESVELLRKIQREVPEYDGQPVGVLIDRMALPAMEAFLRALDPPEHGREQIPLGVALERIVESCNACHRATLHDFIKITPGLQTNPFNQDFAP